MQSEIDTTIFHSTDDNTRISSKVNQSKQPDNITWYANWIHW